MTSAARDPEGRRRHIIDAAVRVIAASGIAQASHRAIAAAASVPLGSTTYYFPTLQDLHEHALQQLARSAREELDLWRERLEASADLPTTLARLAADSLVDREEAVVEYEVYLAAAREPRLRPIAELWAAALVDLLTPYFGPVAAENVSALLDGVMLQALVRDRPVDIAAVAQGITQLTGPASP